MSSATKVKEITVLSNSGPELKLPPVRLNWMAVSVSLLLSKVMDSGRNDIDRIVSLKVSSSSPKVRSSSAPTTLGPIVSGV